MPGPPLNIHIFGCSRLTPTAAFAARDRAPEAGRGDVGADGEAGQVRTCGNDQGQCGQSGHEPAAAHREPSHERQRAIRPDADRAAAVFRHGAAAGTEQVRRGARELIERPSQPGEDEAEQA